jgi:hypothetical protein
MKHTQNTLFGRIIRGRTEEDFAMLSDDPFRRVVMLFGDDGIERMGELPPYEQLITVGYSPEYIRELVTAGYTFRLITFPESNVVEVLPGTWDNIIPIIRKAHIYVEHLVHPTHIELCKRTPFTTFERTAGYSFNDIRRAGKRDPRYMTSERFSRSEPSALNLRLFLYCSLHLRELYSGDGFTWIDENTRGVREYFMRNMRIANIPGVTMTELHVQLP